jgi:hypothetical protein
MKRDLYTKAVLTLIAAAIAVIAFRPAKVVPEARATEAFHCTGSASGRLSINDDARRIEGHSNAPPMDYSITLDCR